MSAPEQFEAEDRDLVTCPTCGGDGVIHAATECPTCEGTGQITVDHAHDLKEQW